MTNLNESGIALGNAYQHMEAVANSVVYRDYKSNKDITNKRLRERALEAEMAFQEAKQALQEAFQDVFEDNGFEFDKAYDMAKCAAESAAYTLRMKAWDKLKAVSS